MKHQWLAYVIVGLLSIGAGVAIAGLPDNVPVDATIIPPTTTEAPPPTVPETTAPPTTATPDTTTPETTEPETTEPETTEPDTTDPEVDELAERSELIVVAANGANVAGTAVRLAELLEGLGYVDVLPLNGSDIVEFTTIYFAEGFEDAAVRLADDLDLLAEFVAPLEDAPSVAELPADTELLAYIGRDRA
jgi:hypothetical protein